MKCLQMKHSCIFQSVVVNPKRCSSFHFATKKLLASLLIHCLYTYIDTVDDALLDTFRYGRNTSYTIQMS